MCTGPFKFQFHVAHKNINATIGSLAAVLRIDDYLGGSSCGHG